MQTYRNLQGAYENVPDANYVASALMGFKKKLNSNDGGMKLLGAVSLAQCLIVAAPDSYVELGAWKGVGALIAQQFLPSSTKMFVFDPNLHLFEERVDGALFSNLDSAQPSYMHAVEGRAFLFADDHQDVLERLITAWIRGYEYVLFDDDYSARADHRTFRNFVLERMSSDGALSTLMELCVDKVVLISKPEIALPDDIDTHWRDQAFLKLKASTARGWTMGAPLLKSAAEKFVDKK